MRRGAEDMHPRRTPRSWRAPAGAVLASLLFLAASFIWLDRPLAWRVGHPPRDVWHAVSLLRHAISIGLDSLLVLLLLSLFEIARSFPARRPVSKQTRALILAGFSAVATVALIDLVLKPVFGRYAIDDFLSFPSRYGFRLFNGNIGSSFPSGHAGLAAAYFTTLQAFYPRRMLWLSVMGLTFAGLIVAQWHFLSDIVAGAMTGSAVASLVLMFTGAGAAQKKDSARGT